MVLQGNLSEFVKVKPEAKSYYELSAATTRFKFPDPGFLDGIKGKSQVSSFEQNHKHQSSLCQQH